MQSMENLLPWSWLGQARGSEKVPENEAKNLGERIRERRRMLEMTQASVAAAAGVTAPNLSRIESGLADPARLQWDTVSGLSRVLGVTPSQLFGAPEGDDERAIQLRRMFERLDGDRQEQLLDFATFLNAQQRKQHRKDRE